jgi:hypothetical protein
MPSDSSHDAAGRCASDPGRPEDRAAPQDGGPGGARIAGFVGRHPALLKVLDWVRRTGPFDNVNP